MQEGASVLLMCSSELLCCEVFHCGLCAGMSFCVVKCFIVTYAQECTSVL